MKRKRDSLTKSSRPKQEKLSHKSSTYKMTECITFSLLGECKSENSSSDEEYWGPHTSIYDSSDGEFSEGYIVKSSKHEEEGLDTPNNVIWENNPTSMKSFPFSKVESFVLPVEGNNPVDYFLHILTDKILNEIVVHTNAYAPQILFGSTTREKRKIIKWKDVTKEEILIFFGLVLHMGIIRLSHAQDYWKTDSLFSIPIFPANMSRNRFLLILRVLHFAKIPDNHEAIPSDRLYRVRNIINLFNSRMSEIYYPCRELSVESMILWRGRLIFRPFLPKKLHKDGVKLFMLTTPTGIVLKCYAQMGMIDDSNEAIMNLMDGLLNVGHSLYIDKYFNSCELTGLLTEKGTHCTGTIKSNRTNLPKDVVERELKTGETYSKYANGVMVGKWKQKKKEITYISNEYKNEIMKIKNIKGETSLKPLPIKQYDAYVIGIKKQNQILSHYPSERNGINWTCKLFIHILQLMVNNSHQLYNKYSGQRICIYDYRLSVIKCLLKQPPRVETVPDPDFNHVVKLREDRKSGKTIRKQCRSCFSKGKRKDTGYVCTVCKGSPGYCLDCVKILHQ